MTDKVQIIKEQANLDISNLRKAKEQGIITEFGKGKLEALEGIVDFINYLQEEPVSEDLEEAAIEYCGGNKGSDARVRAGFVMGAKWRMAQMMAKAVVREVKVDAGGYPYIGETELYDYDKDIPLAKKGDKVKVIVIKED